MSWEDILLKAHSPMLDKASPKQKKRVKKILQSVQPSEYMGQDFTKLGDLIEELNTLDVNKSKPMRKKMSRIEEENVSLVSRAAEMRKDYEILYRQLRGMVYPKSKGSLGEERDERRE